MPGGDAELLSSIDKDKPRDKTVLVWNGTNWMQANMVQRRVSPRQNTQLSMWGMRSFRG